MSMFYCQPSARQRGPGARPHRDDRREPGLSWGEPRRRPAGGEPQRRPVGGEAEPSRNTQVHATTGPRNLRISFTFEESVVVTSSNNINFSIDRNNDTNNVTTNGHQEHEHQHQHGANTGTSTSNQDDGDIDSESSTNSGDQCSSDIMETADLANRFANLRINISPGESSDRPESRSHQLASYTDIARPAYMFCWMCSKAKCREGEIDHVVLASESIVLLKSVPVRPQSVSWEERDGVA